VRALVGLAAASLLPTQPDQDRAPADAAPATVHA
jgi:hypothetical protein